jgi:hypothetical protein
MKILFIFIQNNIKLKYYLYNSNIFKLIVFAKFLTCYLFHCKKTSFDKSFYSTVQNNVIKFLEPMDCKIAINHLFYEE